MQNYDSDLFIELPGESSRRILHPTTVVGTEDDVLLISPHARLALEPGQDLRLYFERDREFMQQPARVESLLSEERLTLAITPLGEPVSAEGRECYRVSTVFADISIDFSGESCPLTDVSITGFSVVSQEEHTRGKTVPIRLVHEALVYEGDAQVQSVTDLGNQTRYGLVCAGCSSGSRPLTKGLQEVSMSVQRSQLRRRAGA